MRAHKHSKKLFHKIFITSCSYSEFQMRAFLISNQLQLWHVCSPTSFNIKQIYAVCAISSSYCSCRSSSRLFSEWNVHVKGKVPFLPSYSKLHFNIRQSRKQRINSTLNHEKSINQQKISKTFFLSFSAERQTGRRASRKIPARRRNKKKNIKAMFVSWLSARRCVWWKILIFCYCMSKDVEGRNLIK